MADDKLKKIAALMTERDGIDADAQEISGRISVMQGRRAEIDKELTQLIGLAAEPKKRGRKPKQTELPI